ncbi:hypothetical protein G134_1417 [Lactobacillus delbrueckii subsp. lactis CRL581]|nr:hypothetical protein G134_1417 [Lactobacillus delbrueckii subsp. lactis CRL581]
MLFHKIKSPHPSYVLVTNITYFSSYRVPGGKVYEKIRLS